MRRALLATAALVVVALALGLRRERPGPSAPPSARPSARLSTQPTALGIGQALIWLDAETPLYMTFEAPGALQGGLP
jgi:hypothetical protein